MDPSLYTTDSRSNLQETSNVLLARTRLVRSSSAPAICSRKITSSNSSSAKAVLYPYFGLLESVGDRFLNIFRVIFDPYPLKYHTPLQTEKRKFFQLHFREIETSSLQNQLRELPFIERLVSEVREIYDQWDHAYGYIEILAPHMPNYLRFIQYLISNESDPEIEPFFLEHQNYFCSEIYLQVVEHLISRCIHEQDISLKIFLSERLEDLQEKARKPRTKFRLALALSKVSKYMSSEGLVAVFSPYFYEEALTLLKNDVKNLANLSAFRSLGWEKIHTKLCRKHAYLSRIIKVVGELLAENPQNLRYLREVPVDYLRKADTFSPTIGAQLLLVGKSILES